MTRNPPLGAPWLTPRLEARLRDLERRLIRARGRMFGERHALEVCGDATREAFDLIVDASCLSGDLVFGIVFHTGVPGGWPNVDQAKLVRPYGHWWIELEDGTIVDVASSQFGHRSPLVIPPGHPMQRLYVPEDPNADELPSGYLPLLVDRHKHRENPYYHGSKTPLEIGAVLRPRPDGYVQIQYEHGDADNWVERYMEERRPKGKLSRLESVFMLELHQPFERYADPAFIFDMTGGHGDYIYEVEPLGPVEASDLRWYTVAAYPRTELGRARAASAYWRGKSAGYLMEHRTPAARVVRLAGGSAAGRSTAPNPSTPFVEFASELPGFLDSDEALAALEGLPTNGGNPWLHGGCFILTEALQDFLGRDAVALDVESHGLDLHSVIEVRGSFGTVWIDGRGAYDPGLARSLFPGMASVELHGRMADEGRVRRLLDALKARFGSVQIPT